MRYSKHFQQIFVKKLSCKFWMQMMHYGLQRFSLPLKESPLTKYLISLFFAPPRHATIIDLVIVINVFTDQNYTHNHRYYNTFVFFNGTLIFENWSSEVFLLNFCKIFKTNRCNLAPVHATMREGLRIVRGRKCTRERKRNKQQKSRR